MKIKNFDELTVSELRRRALEIMEAGLAAIDTAGVIRETAAISENELTLGKTKYDLRGIERVVVVGVGKCSLEAAGELEKILGDRIDRGLVVDVKPGEIARMETYTGTHPLPSPENVAAAQKIINLLKEAKLTEKDLVIFIISGGGSAILCQPQGLTCVEEGEIFKYLTAAGATIEEINTLRKHLSLARGGFLAKYAYPARVVSLIFSDVLGDRLEFVASGPTVKDTTTRAEAAAVAARYGLDKKFNLTEAALIETPKEDVFFERVANLVVVSNKKALTAMAGRALSLGFAAEIKTNLLSGEARLAGEKILADLAATPPGKALLYGGETTVTVKGGGKGGRNQELALSALEEIKEGQLILAFNSDGHDNSDAAGAICDIITGEKAASQGLLAEDYLDRNDSYNFFRQTGGQILTGHTGVNVADLIVAINDKKR